MADEQEFREQLPDNSPINGIINWFEEGDALTILGHIGERGDSGEWNSFQFEVIDNDGDQHTLTYTDEDLPDGTDWNDFFDYLDWLADQYDVDYENSYGESE